MKSQSILLKLSGAVDNFRIVQSTYDGSWRKMWVSRPRVRTDGIFFFYPVDCLRC